MVHVSTFGTGDGEMAEGLPDGAVVGVFGDAVAAQVRFLLGEGVEDVEGLLGSAVGSSILLDGLGDDPGHEV